MRARADITPRRATFTKWAVFGVALPLLPVLANMLAQWIDGNPDAFRTEELFGDGELLVLATVVAAAGIGDLVFDLKRTARARQLRDALAISFALIVVVVSTLVFGLVTLQKEKQGRVDTGTSLSAEAAASQAAALEAQALEAGRQAAQALANARALTASAPKQSSLIKDLQQQARDANLRAADYVERASALRENQAQLARQPEKTVQRNTQQAATASIALFVLSLMSGIFSFLSATRGDEEGVEDATPSTPAPRVVTFVEPPVVAEETTVLVAENGVRAVDGDPGTATELPLVH